MTSDKFLRVPIELAQELEEAAKLKNEYWNSRAKWADYARDLLKKAIKEEKRNGKNRVSEGKTL